jgi:Tfp pilus assembly protein FimV
MVVCARNSAGTRLAGRRGGSFVIVFSTVGAWLNSTLVTAPPTSAPATAHVQGQARVHALVQAQGLTSAHIQAQSQAQAHAQAQAQAQLTQAQAQLTQAQAQLTQARAPASPQAYPSCVGVCTGTDPGNGESVGAKRDEQHQHLCGVA